MFQQKLPFVFIKYDSEAEVIEKELKKNFNSFSTWVLEV